ncbi:hypothetical protein CaCOL14_009909 [Colletotrichum acutatum]
MRVSELSEFPNFNITFRSKISASVSIISKHVRKEVPRYYPIRYRISRAVAARCPHFGRHCGSIPSGPLRHSQSSFCLGQACI